MQTPLPPSRKSEPTVQPWNNLLQAINNLRAEDADLLEDLASKVFLENRDTATVSLDLLMANASPARKAAILKRVEVEVQAPPEEWAEPENADPVVNALLNVLARADRLSNLPA
jgi:hypothetical protein